MSTIPVRHLKPLKLQPENLFQKIVGYRPVRTGSARCEVQLSGNKVIGHVYGHGGAGWTVGPGAARDVCEQLSNCLGEKGQELKDLEVQVVGAGILGLYTAATLINDYDVGGITIYAKDRENTTSHVAGGLYSPMSLNDDEKGLIMTTKHAHVTLRLYEQIMEGKHPFLSRGIRMFPLYISSRESSCLQALVNSKALQAEQQVNIDFGTGMVRSMVEYPSVPFIDTPLLMSDLQGYLKKFARVKFVDAELTSLDQVTGSTVVNCAGLGSSRIANDQTVYPVQGHLIMLQNQTEKHDYFVTWSPSDAHIAPVKSQGPDRLRNATHPFYYIPKKLPNTRDDQVGLIGGSFRVGVGPEEGEADLDQQFEQMIERANAFYGL